MTLPKLDGYDAHAVFTERSQNMQQELICTDGAVNKSALEKHPYFQHLVVALQKHNLADVLLEPAVRDKPGSPRVLRSFSKTIPEENEMEASCGFCEVLRDDMSHKDSLGKDTANRLSRILEEVEDGSEEALDHALADINEWLAKEFDFSSGSGRSTPAASAAVMAQDLYPSEWESLLALHRKAHDTLSQCRTSAERKSIDARLTEELRQVRGQLLDQAERKAHAHHDDASTSSSGKRRRQLPAASLAVLKKWLFTHRDNPYPSEAEKRQLAKEANLDITQVRNWYANVRNRKRNLLRPRISQR